MDIQLIPLKEEELKPIPETLASRSPRSGNLFMSK